MNRMKKRSAALLLALLLPGLMTACGGSSKDAAAPSAAVATESTADYGYWNDAAEAPMEAEAAKGGASNDGGDARKDLPDGVKMIYRANLELETTEFEQAQRDLAALTQRLGGYFEEQNSNNYASGYRSAGYTVRVPAEQFEPFLEQVGALYRVRWQSQSAEDVSERYYDTEARLETARIKLDRLQELLSKAQNMEDIITIESAISDVEYQIESLSGELRHYDALIGYATISVSLQEVYKVSEQEDAPLTFGGRLASAFRAGLRAFVDRAEDLAEWLAYSWLGVLAFAAVVAVAVKLARRKDKRQKPVPPPTTEAPKEKSE